MGEIDEAAREGSRIASLSGKTCGTCASYAEVCCDYGVCERDLKLASRALVTGSDPRWVDAMRVVGWASENLVDAQDGACGRWEEIQ